MRRRIEDIFSALKGFVNTCVRKYHEHREEIPEIEERERKEEEEARKQRMEELESRLEELKKKKEVAELEEKVDRMEGEYGDGPGLLGQLADHLKGVAEKRSERSPDWRPRPAFTMKVEEGRRKGRNRG